MGGTSMPPGKEFPAKAEIRSVVVTEAGSHLRLMDSCITELKAQETSRTCNESKEEEAMRQLGVLGVPVGLQTALRAREPRSWSARDLFPTLT